MWVLRTRQILAGLTNGTVAVSYDPQMSVKGAMLCTAADNAGTKRKKRLEDGFSVADFRVAKDSIVDGTGDVFGKMNARRGKVTRRQMDRMRKDPRATQVRDLQ